MKLSVALQLGRVSNLPTVWSNTLAGVVLSGASAQWGTLAALVVVFSAFYVGGMFLNDAFDAEVDARERPERPIPSGRVSRVEVAGWGYGLLATGIVGLAVVGQTLTGRGFAWPAAAGAALAAAIVAYDAFHKNNPLSPFVMGLCRVLVYVGAAVTVGAVLPAALWIGIGLLLCHLIGLTYIAKQENLERVSNLWPLLFLGAPIVVGATYAGDDALVWLLWAALLAWIAWSLHYLRRRRPGDIGRAVVGLIAGISLLDALLIAMAGAHGLALLAVVAFGCTLLLQRWVAGT